MTLKNNMLFGRIIKIHRYDGTVVIKLENNFVENIPEMESVFIETEGRTVPFFISGYEYNGGEIIKIKFDGYHSAERVNEFNGCMVFLTAFSGHAITDQSLGNPEGYRVILKNHQILGTIKEIIRNPGQDLILILSPENHEILVPMHEDFIVKADRKSKTIIMDLPDGLIELNSGFS